MENPVTPLHFAAMSASLVISVAVPILLAIMWRRKTGAKWVSLWVGALVFPVIVFGLENLCHQLFIFLPNPVSNFVNSHFWVYALYGALAAGIFEETGRLVAFRWLLRKQNGREAGVMYGIGHGGIESILLCGVSMISNMAFCAALNAQGAEALIASTPEASRAAVAASVETMQNIAAGTLLISGVERVIAIALHIALSVLVFTAVKRKRMWLYPVAILLHAFVDFPAALYQKGIIGNIYVLEAMIAVIVAVIVFFAVRVYRTDKPAELPEPDETAAPEEAPAES